MRQMLSTFSRLVSCYLTHKLSKFINNRRSSQSGLRVIPANDFISNEITLSGWYERDLLEDVTRLLSSNNLLGGTLIDVGANIGNHSAWFSQFFDKIEAFEPSPLTFPILDFNAKHMPGTVCVHNYGLSNSNKASKLYTCKSNLGKAGQSPTKGDSLETSIELRKADDLPIRNDPTIRVIKIDVEGHELSVIQGMQKLIATWKPILVLETSFDSDLLKLLSSSGYTHFYHPNSPFRRERGVIKKILGSLNNCRPMWLEFDPYQPDSFEEMAVVSMYKLDIEKSA